MLHSNEPPERNDKADKRSCDHWKKSNEYQGCTSNPAFENISVGDHDQAANAVESVKDSGDQCIFGKDVEEVVIDIEGFGDVLVAFEVSGKTKSRYAKVSIVDPNVGI